MKRIVLAALVLGASACTGFITDPGGEESGSGSGGPSGTTKIDTSKDALLPAPRMTRLSRAQWENTVTDLLGFDAPTGKSSTFPPDPQTAGFLFDNDGASLLVDQALWGSYQRAAEELAEQVIQNATLLQKLLPPDTGDPTARAKSFIESFGRRAYRRKLSAAEIDELFSVYEAAPPNNPALPAFEAGIAQVISAVLQSPFFLYRVETSTKA